MSADSMGERPVRQPRTQPAAQSPARSVEQSAAGQAAAQSGDHVAVALDKARAALAQAKADARKRGSVPGTQGSNASSSQRRGTSGAASRGRSGRGGGNGGSADPRPFGAAIRDLLAERGWEHRAAIGGVFGNWPQIVGPELAEHTTPERFADGELVVVADSTAWATQLRLLAATLVRRLNEELGDGTVRRVTVRGPASAPRRPGAWRVR